MANEVFFYGHLLGMISFILGRMCRIKLDFQREKLLNSVFMKGVQKTTIQKCTREVNFFS